MIGCKYFKERYECKCGKPEKCASCENDSSISYCTARNVFGNYVYCFIRKKFFRILTHSTLVPEGP